MNKQYAAIASALAGVFYLAAPHSLHESTGVGLGASHTAHMAFGASLLILAAVLYLTSISAVRPKGQRYSYQPR
ncbi:MAG: hypothetical protein HYY37_04690 [Candidatus Aenigmarchaeota archaeon]|nr:hypothetical protein [Candidatus Aenigmarchaeota archaeon]